MLELNQTAAYSPSYFFQLFPTAALPGLEEPIVVDTEYRIRETESYSYQTSVMFDVGSSRSGNRFSASGDYGRTDFRNQAAGRADTETSSGRAKYSFAVGRSASLSTEYEYRVSEMGFASYTEHRINVGGEYSRALSASRRATFRFDLGPSLMDGSLVAQETLGTDRVLFPLTPCVKPTLLASPCPKRLFELMEVSPAPKTSLGVPSASVLPATIVLCNVATSEKSKSSPPTF
jgi:hypothetical protein